MNPVSTDQFERRVAFYRAVAISQGTGALTMALIRSTMPSNERPCVRAARLLESRGSGSDRRQRVSWEREAFSASVR